jgi:toxin FitB
MIVADTNVVSEMMKAQPNAALAHWAEDRPSSTIYTTAITVAEIRYGIERLPGGKRRSALAAAADAVLSQFGDRVLPFDGHAADEFGRIMAERQRAGKPIGAFDAQIAAIARSHGATLATRNVRDFDGCGVELVNPWG